MLYKFWIDTDPLTLTSPKDIPHAVCQIERMSHYWNDGQKRKKWYDHLCLRLYDITQLNSKNETVIFEMNKNCFYLK